MKTAIIAIVLAMLVAFSGVASAYPGLVGDVNGDGVVTERDTSLMRTALNARLNATEMVGVSVSEFPDMNDDGRFSYDDIRIIEAIYSSLAGGSRGVGDTQHTIVVGDVDGNGVFDMDDLRQLIDADVIYKYCRNRGRYIYGYIVAQSWGSCPGFNQITRTI